MDKPTTRGRKPRRTPALDAWRREIATGKRTLSTCDWLSVAAGWEQSGLEAAAVGQHDSAREDFGHAHGLILVAAKDPNALTRVLHNPAELAEWLSARRRRARTR